MECFVMASITSTTTRIEKVYIFFFGLNLTLVLIPSHYRSQNMHTTKSSILALPTNFSFSVLTKKSQFFSLILFWTISTLLHLQCQCHDNFSLSFSFPHSYFLFLPKLLPYYHRSL
mmetsp:Transcript_86286/g.168768  ORF Transcript_86286/g.168768 Transcript_86286/m.168768 type:complete len:116 (-) Transcript_86286:1580-1927(-)